MRKLSLVCVVLSLLIVMPVSSAGQKPPKLTPIPLNVTVHAEVAPGVSCGICGDTPGDTVYSHGADSVEAVIDGFGNFIFNFQTGNRHLAYDYSTRLDDPTPNVGAVGLGFRHYLSTIQTSAGGFAPLQNMALNDWQVVLSCPSYVDDAGVTYRHAFARSCGQDPDGSSALKVTRDLNGWTLEPMLVSGAAKVFHLTTRGKTQYLLDGLYSLLFKMTLTPQ